MTDRAAIEKLINYAIKNNASDLHLSSGNLPMVRIDGEIVPIEGHPALKKMDLIKMLESVMKESQFLSYRKNMELDFAIKSDSGSRFRVNSFFTSQGPAAVFREIPSEIITLAEMGAPLIMSDLCKLGQGLILVVGPTGSGKSTTLAAMIHHINEQYKRHIITIEDPIEFTYKGHYSLINQREVGVNTRSFPAALRSALREDPDIIMVGEMRDLETARLAMTAAETGHLVFATLHTNSAAQTINRIIDIFPANDKYLARSMLSSSLQAIISQRLVKKKDGGRTAVYEIMIANSSIRNLIREDKIPQITSMIEIGKNKGMITSKDSVLSLLTRGVISENTATKFINSITL